MHLTKKKEEIKMKIALGSDHGGFELKGHIRTHLEKKGHEILDVGTDNVSSCDYPIYGEKAAVAVTKGDCDCAIVICGTGIGISLAANKVKGARCALVGDCFSAEMAKAHNNANMIALGARILGLGLALKIVDTYLETSFEGGRHGRRVDLISAIENKDHEFNTKK